MKSFKAINAVILGCFLASGAHAFGIQEAEVGTVVSAIDLDHSIGVDEGLSSGYKRIMGEMCQTIAHREKSGKLGSIVILFNPSTFPDFFSSLRAKYGDPTSHTIEAV